MSEWDEQERQRRATMWERLVAQGGPTGVRPTLLRDLGIYGGAQGIWVDKERTAADSEHGVTVGILHTGSSYADDLADDGVIYHYPKTRRPGRDTSEVTATKEAGRRQLPVFVTTYPTPNSNLRDVRRGWIEGWDDRAAIFLVSFEETPPEVFIVEPADDETGFSLTDASQNPQVPRAVRERRGQQRFKFRVLRRYGAECAVCGLSVMETLDAAHLRPKKKRGSDDPRNGLVLCASHHRAFDADLFAVEPETLAIQSRDRGPTLVDLQITRESLTHLPRSPHADALRWRWERLRRVLRTRDRGRPVTEPRSR